MHTRVGPFGFEDELSSAEINGIDLNAANSLDKTSAGDNLDGYITVRGPDGYLAFGSGTTLLLGHGSSFKTAAGANITCNLTFPSGSTLTVGNLFSEGLDTGSVSCTGSITADEMIVGTLDASGAIHGATNIFADGYVKADEYQVTSVSQTRFLSPSSVTGSWTFDPASGWYTGSAASSNYAYWDLSFLPHGQSITAMTAYIDPTAHGAVPNNPPRLGLVRVSLSTGAATSVSYADDPSIVAIYEVYHGFPLSTNLPHTIDKANYAYFAYLRGEYGTNSLSDMVVKGLLITYTVTSLDLA